MYPAQWLYSFGSRHRGPFTKRPELFLSGAFDIFHFQVEELEWVSTLCIQLQILMIR